MATHVVSKYYYNTGFGDPKMCNLHPKVSLGLQVQNHWLRLVRTRFAIIKTVSLISVLVKPNFQQMSHCCILNDF